MSHPHAPADPEKLFVDLRAGGQVAYTSEGSGPTVLAVHGHPGSVRDWRWLAPTLTPQMRLIRIDLPGHGQTPIHARFGHTPHEKARFVLEVIDALDLPQCVLIGHSFGGAACIAAAAMAPDRINGLALVASIGTRAHHAIRKRDNLRFLLWLLSFWPTRVLLRPLLRWSIIQAGFPRSTTGEETALAVEAVGSLNFPNQCQAIEDLQCSTLITWATDDQLIEPAIFEELAECCPAGPRLPFDQGGHNIQKTQAKAIGAALCEWVSKSIQSPR